MTMNNSPCCGHAGITIRHADGYIVGYRCQNCGTEYELCRAELSDGGRCERFVRDCPYDAHRDDAEA